MSAIIGTSGEGMKERASHRESLRRLRVVAARHSLITAIALHVPVLHAQFREGVNVHTGVKVESVVDYADPAGRMDFKRLYTSALIPSNPSAIFGGNWRSVYDASLLITSTFVRANRPSGNVYLFTGSGSTWTPEPDVHERLTVVLSGANPVAWRLTLADNRVEQYDTSGKLERIEFPDGEELAITRDTSGRTLSVTNRQGRSLQLTYAGSFLDRVLLPDGRVIKYGYLDQRLTSVSYQSSDGQIPAFNTTAYTYAAASGNLLSGIIEDQQAVASWSYDAVGRVTASRRGNEQSEAGRLNFVYGVGKTFVTDASGATVTYQTSVLNGRALTAGTDLYCRGCGSASYRARTFDTYGNPDVTTALDGTESDADYNSRGLPEREISALNSPTAKRTVETTWHSSLRLPVERRTYDASGTLVQRSNWTYNSRGQVLNFTVYDPATSLSRVTLTTYCEQAGVAAGTCPLTGLVLSVDGPRTDVMDVTSYQYYASDNADCAATPETCSWRKGDLWRITNAKGQVLETLAYDGAGRALSTKDTNGVVIDFTYDSRGRLASRTVRSSN